MATEQDDNVPSRQRLLRTPAWAPLSPWKHLTITTTAIFCSEIAAMSIVGTIKGIPFPLLTLADAAIMTILVFPILYALSFRPLLQDISQRRRTEAALRQSNTEHVRVERERETHLRRLEVLIEASHRILAESTLDGVLRRVTDEGKAITGARTGLIGRVASTGEPTGGLPPCLGRLTAPQPGTTFTIPRGGQVADALSRRPSIRLTDDELRANPVWHSLVLDQTTSRGLLGARLVDQDGAPCGMIVLSDRVSGDFSAEDEAMLAPLAALASLALQHIQARTQAQEKADELDAVFNAMVEPVVISDGRGTLRRANPAAVAALGLDPTGTRLPEALERLSARHHDGDELESGEFPIARALAGETVSGQRIRFTTASGEDAVVVATASPLRTSGVVSGAVTVWHDITERVKAEVELRAARDALEARVVERTRELARANAELRDEIADRERIELALRDSEDRYRTFLQNFQGIAFRANLGVAPLFFHGAVQAITGYSEADFLAGTPHWQEIIHPDDLADAVRSMELARSSPDFSTEREYRIIRKDGQVRWLREYIQNSCDASGTPTLVQGALYDITDRMESERHKAVTRALLELFALKTSRQEYLDAVVELVREWTAVQSVGVRLRDARDGISFEAHVGFEQGFLDSSCRPPEQPGCPCSRVIVGAPDSRDLLVTTAAGSFHCADIAAFRDSLSPEERALYTGSCLNQDFGSTAIVPIRYRGHILGAVQLADQRNDVVSPVTLAFIESIVPLIGEAVQRFNLEQELRRFAKEQSVLYAVATAATSFLDPTSLLDAVLEVVLPALDTDAGWVSLPGPAEDDPPHIAVSYGVPKEFLAAEESFRFTTCPTCGPLLCGGAVADAPQLVAECPRLSPDVLGASGIHSHVSVPLNAGGDLLGILNIAWREHHHYTPEERAMLRAVGDLVGVALANARLFKTAHDRARHLATLNGIGQAISSSLDVDQVLVTLTEEVRQAIGAQAGFVALADEDTGELVYRHVVGVPDGDLRGLKVHPGEGIATWVVTNRQAAVANAGDRGGRFEAAIGSHAGLAVTGMVVAPLLARDRVVGIVELCNKRGGVFTEADAQLLESAAAAAAVAVENARLFKQARTERERLQVLSRQLVEVQETERMVVARELHDDAGQTLTALMVGLRLLEREAGDPQAVSARVAELKRTADGVLENLHRLASNLRPASLDHLGLVATLRQNAQSLNSASGLTVRFEARGFDAPRLPPAVETALYRIAQEAMTNAIRHAKASQVEVLLDRRDHGIIIAIEDDGTGFDPEVAARGRRLGLVGMRERVEMLGGKLHLRTAPGSGTAVIVEVPNADSHSDSR